MTRIFKNCLIALCLISLMISCKDETTIHKKKVRPVRIEKISKSQQQFNKINLPASVNELSDTKLSFRVGGPIVKLNDVVGNQVKKGEVIAQLDQRDFKIGIEATKSSYELAKAEYERYKNLIEKESISQSAFDQIETRYKITKTNYDAALNAFKDTEIKAPFAGYIHNVFVNNFESVAPGHPIISLLDMSKYEINAWISVIDASKINNETKYTCIVKQEGKEFRIAGKLKEIGNKTSITKQSLPITIIIDSPKDIKLRAGTTTHLELSTNNSQIASYIQVPPSSIFTKNNITYVWVFNEKTNTVSSKEVSTGKIFGNGNLEITKGLKGKENIVTAGVNYLFENQEVKKMEEYSKSNIGNKL
ncbi:efflux RND transporter periplasmic adaptor subunit [Lutibacter citreus]|uniref:efflux RND transporter periplasmic adaptor subunit n=1 Tax=Lutibacter citreus TaxID=2138210 RepID=UPI000DBE83B6|nr:efflux RND transporter periplasmic adaptor subunit [Lutibacter citreus]